MYLSNYLGMLHRAEEDLAEGFRKVGDGHGAEPDIYAICHTLAGQCDERAEKVGSFAERYGEVEPGEGDRPGRALFGGVPREGALGLLRDLHDLHTLASFCDLAWTMIGQAAQGTQDAKLLEVVQDCEGETDDQLRWLETRMKQAAPQILVVAS